MVCISLSSFQFGSQRAKIRLEGHQGVRRYIQLLRDKVAEPIFRTCIGTARTTLGRQVLETYFLPTMGRYGFANKLKPFDLFLYIVALAPRPEPISYYGHSFSGMMTRLDTGDGIPHSASHHMCILGR
jgi:hypothetical protein